MNIFIGNFIDDIFVFFFEVIYFFNEILYLPLIISFGDYIGILCAWVLWSDGNEFTMSTFVENL